MARSKAQEQEAGGVTATTTTGNHQDEGLLTLSFAVDSASNLPIQYANQLTLQEVDGMFLLSFFQTIPPILMGDREEQATQLKALKTISAPCVGRIMIAPNRLPEFARVLMELAEHLPNKEKVG